MEKQVSELFFNDTWNLYFHDPDNQNWEIDSYILLTTISTVEDWITAYQSFKDVFQKGMFFLMREYIQPIWEDENNRNGGCLSFKIWKNEVADIWFELGCKLLGETLLNDKNKWDKLCGISISPKRSYCIGRIWIGDTSIVNTENYNMVLPNYSKILYKSHIDNKDYETL
jgi:hypothetical protein